MNVSVRKSWANVDKVVFQGSCIRMARGLTERSKVEQRREILAVGKSCFRVPEFVKEGMDHRLHRSEPARGRVFQKSGDKLQGFWWCPGTEDLAKGVRFDLRELVLHVVGVHRLNLLPRRCSQNLDDLNQLIDSALSREEGLSQHQLGHNTSC